MVGVAAHGAWQWLVLLTRSLKAQSMESTVFNHPVDLRLSEDCRATQQEVCGRSCIVQCPLLCKVPETQVLLCFNLLYF